MRMLHIIFHTVIIHISQKASLVDGSPYVPHKVRTDGAIFVVYRQPIALDRFTIHDVRPGDITGMPYVWENVSNTKPYVWEIISNTKLYVWDRIIISKGSNVSQSGHTLVLAMVIAGQNAVKRMSYPASDAN